MTFNFKKLVPGRIKKCIQTHPIIDLIASFLALSAGLWVVVGGGVYVCIGIASILISILGLCGGKYIDDSISESDCSEGGGYVEDLPRKLYVYNIVSFNINRQYPWNNQH